MSKRNVEIQVTQESKLLRRFREDASLSLRELGRRMNYSASRVSQFELGREDISDEYIDKFIDAVNISREEWDFCCGDDIEKVELSREQFIGECVLIICTFDDLKLKALWKSLRSM